MPFQPGEGDGRLGPFDRVPVPLESLPPLGRESLLRLDPLPPDEQRRPRLIGRDPGRFAVETLQRLGRVGRRRPEVLAHLRDPADLPHQFGLVRVIRVPEEVQAPDQSGVEVDEGGPGVAPERGAVVRQAPAGVVVVDPLLPEELAERDPPHLGHPEPLLGVPVQGAGVAADEDRPVRLPARRLAGLQR